MILADKIIKLRKKSGWSQEELAERMEVSRQAVSKWESAHAIPDIDKILMLSDLFGVSTDYLLKDSIDDEDSSIKETKDDARKISIDEANSYLAERKRASYRIGCATFLCIISPIALFILSVVAEHRPDIISQNLAEAIGIGVLFAFILAAVPIFIYCGYKNEPYVFLDKNVSFELERGVKSSVVLQRNQFTKLHAKLTMIGTSLCIVSPLPLIFTGFGQVNEIVEVCTFAVMLLLVGSGVILFIVAETQLESMQRLLQEGNYTKKGKLCSGLKETVGFCYFGILTAIYLAWSFLSMKWHISWILFAVGAVLFPVAMKICEHIVYKSEK